MAVAMMLRVERVQHKWIWVAIGSIALGLSDFAPCPDYRLASIRPKREMTRSLVNARRDFQDTML
jgi:hypothetical protein